MKSVTFDSVPVVFYIRETDAHRKARESIWIQEATDRQRFKDRIQRVAEILIPILRKHGKNCK